MRTLKLALMAALLLGSARLFAQINNFEWQNMQREYIVHTPSHHDGTPPVMFYLHGLGGNISNADAEYHFAEVCERFGWEVVVPQAVGATHMWNAAMYNSNTDDVGFLMALLDTLTVQHHLDPDSVFFTGFSMGGFMTHRLAIEKGDRITACAPVSGLITFAMSQETPVAPVKMLHIHGTNDPVVGYDGSSQVFGGTLGIDVEAIIDYWSAANGCEGEPVIDTLPNTHNDGLRFVRYTYDCGTEFQHLKVIGGNHTWYLNSNQTDIAYLDEIYAFFTGTQQGTSVGLDVPAETGLKVWPNPASGSVELSVDEAGAITLFNVMGQQMMTQQLAPGVSRLDLSTFPSGMYFLKDERGSVAKLIVR